MNSMSDPELIAAQHSGLLEPAVEKSPDEYRLEHPQLVSVLTGQNFRPVILHVEQNQPQLRALELIRLSRTADAWTATLDADLQIDSGMVDTLRFDLPANWVGPFEISPAVPWSLETVIGENRRQLVLRPESPFEHSVRLQVSGPLTIAAGQHASAPDVRLLDAIRQSRFLLLPRRLENQQLAWTTRGLVPRQVPDSMASIVSDPSLYRIYQMVGEHCRADLRSIDSSAESPRIRLVDVDWLWNLNGTSHAVAAFDIDPAGATSCELQLPADGNLVQAQLDAVPAQLSPLGDNRWNVWLGDNKLPRHLEVIFVVNHSQLDGKTLLLSAPALVDLPIDRTLWTVWSPAAAGVGTPMENTSVSPLQLQQDRLKSAAASLDTASNLLLDESPDDVARWYVPWQRRFAASRANLVIAKVAGSADAHSTESELNAIDQQQTKLSHKLIGVKQDADAAAELSRITDWLHLATLEERPDHHATLALVTAADRSLAVEYPQWNLGGVPWRSIAAAGIGLLTIGCLFALRLTRLAAWRLRLSPQLLGVSIGLVWWLWLTPAIVGPAIIAISLFSMWQSHSMPAHALIRS
jgi:hypothetical protein